MTLLGCYRFFLAGLLLGGFFFAGLFWTIRQGLLANHPAFWFIGSSFVRIAVVLGGFYLISAGQWQRLVVCTAGFFIARVVMIRLTRMPTKPSSTKQEVGDAP